MPSSTSKPGASYQPAPGIPELIGDSPIDSHAFGASELPLYSFEDQLAIDEQHNRPHIYSLCRPYHAEMVVDDCAKARFYARALEYYLLDGEHKSTHENGYWGCPLAKCPAQKFSHPKDMLRHLRHCKSFSVGSFWCPTCQQWEAFPKRSNQGCSWDKEHLRQKLREGYKDIKRALTGGCGLCSRCSAPVQPPGLGNLPSYDATTMYSTPMTMTASTFAPWPPQDITEAPYGQPHRTELSAQTIPCELESDYVPELAPGPTWGYDGPEPIQQGYSHTSPSAVTSPNGSLRSAASVSPTSSTSEEAAAIPRSNGQIILRRGSNRTMRVDERIDIHDPHILTGVPDTWGPLSSVYNMSWLAPVFTTSLPPLAPPPEEPAVLMDVSSSMIESPPRRPSDISFTGIPSPQIRASMSTPVVTVPVSPNQFTPDSISPQSLVSSYSSFSHSSQLASVSPLSNPPLTSNSSQPSLSSPVSSESDLKCEVCGFVPSGIREKHQSYLLKHQRLKHTKSQRLSCSQCEKTFTRKDNLTSHIRKKHRDDKICRRRRRRRGATHDSWASPGAD